MAEIAAITIFISFSRSTIANKAIHKFYFYFVLQSTDNFPGF